MKTSWESMKLALPKFIMPFLFISYPSILSFNWEGFIVFIIAGVGFMALSAGIQSGWGWWQQILLIILGVVILFIPAGKLIWIFVLVTIVIFFILWNRFADSVVPAKG